MKFGSLTDLTQEVFVRDLLKGRRLFLEVKIKEYNNQELLKGINEYLKNQPFESNPVHIVNAVIQDCVLPLHLPYLKIETSSLKNVDFRGANLDYACLGYNSFDKVNFTSTSQKDIKVYSFSKKDKVIGLEGGFSKEGENKVQIRKYTPRSKEELRRSALSFFS